MKEMRAHGISAVWQAVCDYDPSRGVPFSAYARQRVWASALTRYRQEWAFALRTSREVEEVCDEGRGSYRKAPCRREPCRRACLSGSAVDEWLPQALAQLSESESWLILQLFWEGRTEVEIAHQLGITQQAVSKRKGSILRGLLRRL